MLNVELITMQMVPETEHMIATAQSILLKMVELNVMMVINVLLELLVHLIVPQRDSLVAIWTPDMSVFVSTQTEPRQAEQHVLYLFLFCRGFVRAVEHVANSVLKSVFVVLLFVRSARR